MTTQEIVEAFRAADPSGLPALAALDDRHKVFWVMKLGRTIGLEVMTPSEISAVLRDAYSYVIPRQRIEGMLAAEKHAVARRSRHKRRVYQLMKPGEDELDGTRNTVIFIEPSKGFSGLRETHALFATMSGEVRICDPYTDLKTLDMLAECTAATAIRLLTDNVRNKSGFGHAVKAFRAEHRIALDVRLASPKILHDRYAIYDDGMILFGTSLNGLGLKQSFVVAVGPDIRATVLRSFETSWQQSAVL